MVYINTKKLEMLFVVFEKIRGLLHAHTNQKYKEAPLELCSSGAQKEQTRRNLWSLS